MKCTIIASACLLLAVIYSGGCSQQPPATPNNTKEIVLSRRIMRVDHINTKDSIKIREGNGGYQVIPDTDVLTIVVNGEWQDYTNTPSTDQIKAAVVGDSLIIVDRFYQKDTAIYASYHLLDREGKIKSFVVWDTDLIAGEPEWRD